MVDFGPLFDKVLYALKVTVDSSREDGVPLLILDLNIRSGVDETSEIIK